MSHHRNVHHINDISQRIKHPEFLVKYMGYILSKS